MLTRLRFSDPKKNLEVIQKQLLKKYKNIEDLSADVQRNKCSDPMAVDDYMLWHAINTINKDKEIHSEEHSTSERPQIMIREEIIFHTTEFYSVLTPRRMEILEYIYAHDPISVKALAAETGRDYKNVYDDVTALEQFNLLELVREGKNRRPITRLTEIEISFTK